MRPLSIRHEVIRRDVPSEVTSHQMVVSVRRVTGGISQVVVTSRYKPEVHLDTQLVRQLDGPD